MWLKFIDCGFQISHWDWDSVVAASNLPVSNTYPSATFIIWMDYTVTMSPFWKGLYLDCSNSDGLYTPQAPAFPTWHCWVWHQDNELEVWWCLSWLTELCESPQSKIHARHVWVHLLEETSVSLNIMSFMLLIDDSALVVKTYTLLWIEAHWLLSPFPLQGFVQLRLF